MPTYIEIAQQFGNLVATTDYAGAHALLTKMAQVVHSPGDFGEAVVGMTTYAPGPIQKVLVMEDYILEDWPDKQDEDVAFVYVSLEGDGYCEGVALTLAQENNEFRIRDLQWGRP